MSVLRFLAKCLGTFKWLKEMHGRNWQVAGGLDSPDKGAYPHVRRALDELLDAAVELPVQVESPVTAIDVRNVQNVTEARVLVKRWIIWARELDAAATADVDSEGRAAKSETTGMTVPEVAKQLECIRSQGQPWSSYNKLASQIGCSSRTVHTAVQGTPELKAWANSSGRVASKAQSLNPVVTDRTAQSTEPDPADEAAIREFIENADPQTKAWFLALPCEKQLDVLNDPDAHGIEEQVRILGRKP